MSGWPERARRHVLPGGHLRLTHGPIDVIVRAEGDSDAVARAQARAAAAFAPVLERLVEELPRLRAASGTDLQGPVARRMQHATAPFAPTFLTPMAAVAGAVADHLLAAIIVPGHGLERVHVNNGGDIALWQRRGAMTLAICDDPAARCAGARATIPAGSGIGGIATSGWRGRSHSLGIADAVTVLAADAARADAAATLIANAVDLPHHPAVRRRPACELAPDSDLGDRPVTVGVGPITLPEAWRALDRGRALARDYLAHGLIAGACLALAGERCAIGETINLPEPIHA